MELGMPHGSHYSLITLQMTYALASIYIYIYMAGSQGPPSVLCQHVVESVQNIAVISYYKHSILDLRYGE